MGSDPCFSVGNDTHAVPTVKDIAGLLLNGFATGVRDFLINGGKAVTVAIRKYFPVLLDLRALLTIVSSLSRKKSLVIIC